MYKSLHNSDINTSISIRRTQRFDILMLMLMSWLSSLAHKRLLCLCINQFQRCPSPPPPGNRGAFAHVVSPGGGAFAILSLPRGLGISIPRGETRAFDTRVFVRHISVSGRTRPFFKDWLVHQGLEKLVDVFKGMFSQF